MGIWWTAMLIGDGVLNRLYRLFSLIVISLKRGDLYGGATFRCTDEDAG